MMLRWVREAFLSEMETLMRGKRKDEIIITFVSTASFKQQFFGFFFLYLLKYNDFICLFNDGEKNNDRIFIIYA